MALAVALGLVLVPVAARWIAEIEWVRYSDNSTTQALFPHSIAILVLLTTLSAGVRRVVPALGFRRRELLACYVCVCVGSHLAGHDMLQVLYSSIAYVIRQATQENNYAQLIHPYLPAWSVPKTGPGLRAFFEGGATLFSPGVVDSWREPALAWGAFTLVLCLVMLGVNSLLRSQWEDERLTYPITQVPLSLTRDDGAAMLDRVFLLGVLIGALPTIMNTVKHFYPIWPGMRVQVRYYQLDAGIWAFAGNIPVCWHPFAFGLAYLVPADLAFSCWFFYLYSCMVRVIAAARGYKDWNGFPYVNQQTSGAHIGLALIVLWNARRRLAAIAREIRRPTSLGRAEALSYRAAAALVVVGCGALVWFFCQVGLGLPLAIVYLLLLLAVCLAVTRLRAEYGLPTNELFRRGTDYILVSVAGSRAFGRQRLVGMGLMNWLGRTYRQLPQQVQIDALEVGRRSGIPLRSVGWMIAAATVVGIASAKWALLDVSLREGIATAKVHGPAMWAFGPEPWNDAASWINNPTNPDLKQGMGFAFGAVFALLLYKARVATQWWPLHPGGYVMAWTYGLARLWTPLFFVSIIKTVVLRYGGHTTYLRLRPLFLGFIVGEYCTAVIRTLVDIAWKLYLPAESGIGGL